MNKPWYSYGVGRLRRWRSNFDLMHEAASIVAKQTAALHILSGQVDEAHLAALESQRAARDIAVSWRISMEQPEIDLRETIDALISDLSDQVAKLEELIVA